MLQRFSPGSRWGPTGLESRSSLSLLLPGCPSLRVVPRWLWRPQQPPLSWERSLQDVPASQRRLPLPLPWRFLKEGPQARKCLGLCSGSGHSWTHCPLFSRLLMTLGQLDSTHGFPWPGHLRVLMEDSQAGGMVLSPSVALGGPPGPICGLRVWDPQHIWGVSGHDRNCLPPEDRESLRQESRRKGPRPS